MVEAEVVDCNTNANEECVDEENIAGKDSSLFNQLSSGMKYSVYDEYVNDRKKTGKDHSWL